MDYGQTEELKRIANTLEKILQIVVITLSKEDKEKIKVILKPKKEVNTFRPEQVYKKAVNTLKRKTTFK